MKIAEAENYEFLKIYDYISTKMIKTFIIVLLICGIFWGVIRQQNTMPPRLKLANKLNTAKIDNIEINSTAMSEKKFIPNENKQPKDAVSVEADHAIIQTNAILSHTSSINFTWNDRKLIPITADEHHSNNAQRKKLSFPDAVWKGRKFIITTTAEKHSEIAQRKTFSSPDAVNTKENTNESKQQSPSENQSDILTEPDKVHCPLVEKIQQTAQQINDAFLYEGTYRIVSYEPVFQDSDVNWLVGVRDIVAGSSDEAIYMAGMAIRETNHLKNEYAEMLDGPFTLFACYYGPGDIIALGIWDKVSVEE